MSAQKSVFILEPSVPSNFDFLLDPQPTRPPGVEQSLLDTPQQATDVAWCKLCGRECRIPKHRAYGLAWDDREISAWTKTFGVEGPKTFREEEWKGLEPIPSPANYKPLPTRPDRTPLWRTSTSTFEFFGDLNTPLPGPWQEPIEFRYFNHAADCPNPISPNDLMDEHGRPLKVRGCKHCAGKLRVGQSAANTWTTPMHWDLDTQEVFAASPTPKPWRYKPASWIARREVDDICLVEWQADARENGMRFCQPKAQPTTSSYPATHALSWVTQPVIEDGKNKVEGHWEEWVVREMRPWTRSQKKHDVDQNYFASARMQGATRNSFCIFNILTGDDSEILFSGALFGNDDKTPDERDRSSDRYLVVAKRVPEEIEPARESDIANDDNKRGRSWRLSPWYPTHFVYENEAGVFRVWSSIWKAPGKTVHTTDTVRLREEYESDLKTHVERLELLRDAVPQRRTGFSRFTPCFLMSEKTGTNRTLTNTGGILWFVTENHMPTPTKGETAEWEHSLKELGLAPLAFDTRETRAVSATRKTRYASTVKIDHDSAEGVKLNTLRQRAIRTSRKAEAETQYASDEIPLLSRYVDQMSPEADPLCEGGCFALVPFNRRLDLKRLGPYDLPVDEAFDRLDEERKASMRNAVKLTRRKARRSNRDSEGTEALVQDAKARIKSAFEQSEIFRRSHCIEHRSPDKSA